MVDVTNKFEPLSRRAGPPPSFMPVIMSCAIGKVERVGS